MPFAELLDEVLPADLPARSACVRTSACHLERIVETNRHFNLTRIVEEREAAIKHVFDSVAPWMLFSGAAAVADAGTGAGFPGIPLSVVLPEARFTLLESTRKKAQFVASTAEALKLANVTVAALRAEDWLKENRADVVTARAVAPLARALALFAPALRQGARLLLYKGPDGDSEIREAAPELRKRRLEARVTLRYELPAGMGARSIVEVRAV